ncbi:Cell death protease [Dimargaris verticillata]|uniref:Pheromone-processing carboxypeptidase KEX1 n=1 Tax=Dimargaris verticillata TaxID=2761393 RepID=A0A9W8ECB5_9FUNG|nr:Cell death protease [Dimargaris verticillata]
MDTIFGNPNIAPYRITDLPRLTANVSELLQYSGQIPVSEDGEDVMFFWLVYNTTALPPKAHPSHPNRKLLVWFNGGPGCTSLDGVFLENGPYAFTENNDVGRREWSLTRSAVMLYIDQPLGTGYSYARTQSYSRTYEQSTAVFAQFLANFYTLFPELKPFGLYLGGESQAGVYLPYIAQELLRRTQENVNGYAFPLKGLIIGNGWIDPLHQYPAVFEFSKAHQLHATSIEPKVNGLLAKCMHDYESRTPRIGNTVCEHYVTQFLKLSSPEPGKCYNTYDYRLIDSYPSCGMNWPPKIHEFTKYFRDPDVWRALHVDRQTWSNWIECNTKVGHYLENTTERPGVTLLPELLEQLPILFVAGDKDILCNYMGVEAMVDNMHWNGQTGFRRQGLWTWEVADQPAGYYMADRNLTYVRLFNASHMAGVDKPRELYDLMTRFMHTDRKNLPFKSRIIKTLSPRTGKPVSTPPSSGHFLAGTIAATLIIFALIGLGLFLYRRYQRRVRSRMGEYASLDHAGMDMAPAMRAGLDNSITATLGKQLPGSALLHNPKAPTQDIQLSDLVYQDDFLLDDGTASEATDPDDEDAPTTSKRTGKHPRH